MGTLTCGTIPFLWCDQEFLHCAHETSLLESVLSYTNPAHTRAQPTSLISTQWSQLRQGLPSSRFTSSFPTKNVYASLIFPLRRTYHSPILLKEAVLKAQRSGHVEDLIWSRPKLRLTDKGWPYSMTVFRGSGAADGLTLEVKRLGTCFSQDIYV